MAVIIHKKNSVNTSKILSEKLKKKQSNGNLKNHFGKLKRNFDGISYQTAIREDED